MGLSGLGYYAGHGLRCQGFGLDKKMTISIHRRAGFCVAEFAGYCANVGSFVYHEAGCHVSENMWR